MVRRGILLLLAGVFLFAGASVLYNQLDAFAVTHTNRFPTSSEPESFRFPFAVPGTNLVALELRSYDGLCLEEGSQEGLTDTAALILRNDGTELLKNASVELSQGSRTLCFELDYLPPGEKILVIERDQSKYTPDAISACCGIETVARKEISGLVSIRQPGNGTVLLTNRGQLPIKSVTVYFKNYDYENAMYLGGIVYEIPVRNLTPGETYIAKPMYYSEKTSRIVKIKTSGTD